MVSAAAFLTSSPSAQDEVFLQGEGASLCLVINRRMRSVRVIDFRSGTNPAKARLVAQLARKEGLERVFTLVERDEVSSWSRLGFAREGTIPAFYKRSDAWLLGTSTERLAPLRSEDSGVRRAIHDQDETAAEQVHLAAKRLAKQRADESQPAARLQLAKDADVKKAVSAASRAGRALSGFEPFGRDVVRQHYLCTARGGFSLALSVESQHCFNNALIELLTSPRTEKEAALTRVAVRLLCDELFENDVVCCFATSPADDLELATAYLMNGFRRTGLLHGHALRAGRRIDVFLWSRRLALPSDG